MFLEKEELILFFSNPDKVFERLKEIYPEEKFEFKISGRKNKKYAIRGDFTHNKWVHFGHMGMADYTKHESEVRKELFKSRNHKWANKPINSPAYLSYWALW
jgi:hypothetical protein